MKAFLALLILSSALSLSAYAEDEAAPVAATPEPPANAEPPPQTPPAVEQPTVASPEPVKQETPIVVTPNLPDNKNSSGNGRSRSDDNRKGDDHRPRESSGKKWDGKKDSDWKKDDWKHDKKHSNPPRIIYRRAPPKIVYIYPQSYYPVQEYREVYRSYPDDYVPDFHVGGFLPPERQWRPLPDYARYGLPAPRQGETWLYNERDAVLIDDQTLRIVSAFVLAYPVE